jgi:fusarinine C synthase
LLQDATATSRPYIITYFVPEVQIDQQNISQLRQLISSVKYSISLELPKYMIPAKWIPLEKIPFTPNGKLDNKKLNAIYSDTNSEFLMTINSNNLCELTAPETESEIFLQESWSKVLSLELNQIGKYSSFFSLGGDSISAIMLAMNCRSAGYSINVSDIIQSVDLQTLSLKLIKLNESEIIEYQSTSLDRNCWNDILFDYSISENDVADLYPCTDLQNGLLADTLIRSSHHFDHCSLNITCQYLDKNKLKQAVESAVNNNAILKSTVILSKCGFLQIILQCSTLVWSEIELKNEDEYCELLNTQNGRLLELGMPLSSFILVQMPNRYVLLWSCHHSVVNEVHFYFIFFIEMYIC